MTWKQFLIWLGWSQPKDEPGISPGPVHDPDYRVSLTWLGKPHGGYKPGNYGRKLSFGGRERYYEFHLPTNIRPNVKYPVVLCLHGGGGNPAMQRYISGMDAVSDREGFVAVYPAGTNPRFNDRQLFWNAGRPLKNPSQAADDVGFIAAVIDDLAKYVLIDRDMVYASGISNGGQMCYRLAVELSDRIATIGPVAGHFSADEFPKLPSGPINVIHFHGKLDKFAPIIGGSGPATGGPFLPYEIQPLIETIQSWVRFDSCEPIPTKSMIGQAEQVLFPGGREGSEVVLWLLHDGGHTWPGGKDATEMDTGHINMDISASEKMWQFFTLHPLGANQ